MEKWLKQIKELGIGLKHPRKDGQVELVEMKGDIRLEGVDFWLF